MQKTNEKQAQSKHWANKGATAKYYGVCPNTITKWQALGYMACFKLGRVVRFDLVGSDALLKENGVI